MSDEHKCTRPGGTGIAIGIGLAIDSQRQDITCREIGEFLLAYLEHDLGGGARAEFERHLNKCPPCVHYIDGYRETIELVRRCVRDEPGAGSGVGPGGGSQCGDAPKHKPPEGLIQAILAAKRSIERG